jgi:hypothetical protein
MGFIWQPTSGGSSGGGGGFLPNRLAVNLAAGVTNNFNPGGGFPGTLTAPICVLEINPNAGNAELTGLLAGLPGQSCLIINSQPIGGNTLQLDNLNAGSLAANRFTLSGANMTLFPQQRTLALYDGTLGLWSVG